MTFTPRDVEILERLLLGWDNLEIACELHITRGTVKRHLHDLFLRAHIEDGSRRTRLAMLYRDMTGAKTSPATLPALTPRENEIFHLLAQGRSNVQIAALLEVGLSSIKKMEVSLLDKFGAWNRTELALKCPDATYVV